MAGKSGAMVQFVLGLVILSPIGIVTGVIGLGWAWTSFTGCFLSISYVCGQVEWFKAFLFAMISFGCFTLIKQLWGKTK